MKTQVPFAQALDELLTERELSQRQLSKMTAEHDDSVSNVMISYLRRGDMEPSKRAMEAIAKALLLDPSYFAEWRLEAKRAELNWRHVGLKAALKALGE